MFLLSSNFLSTCDVCSLSPRPKATPRYGLQYTHWRRSGSETTATYSVCDMSFICASLQHTLFSLASNSTSLSNIPL